MKWEDIVSRKDLIGGEIETHDQRYIYRGPINSISIEQKQVCIQTQWMAWKPAEVANSWTQWPTTSCSFSTDILPTSLGEGCVIFQLSRLSFAIIFPKGNRKPLDPAQVKGLEV